MARDAGVKLLALTHLSSRYGGGDVEREARTVFPETVVPRDFDLIEIPFQERGGPELVKSGARLPRAEVPSRRRCRCMTRMVQVAIAGDVAEGEEIQSILTTAGIESELTAAGEDDLLTVVVPESSLEAAQDAIEALSEPDELIWSRRRSTRGRTPSASSR